jgi:hypothetical protein
MKVLLSLTLLFLMQISAAQTVDLAGRLYANDDQLVFDVVFARNQTGQVTLFMAETSDSLSFRNDIENMGYVPISLPDRNRYSRFRIDSTYNFSSAAVTELDTRWKFKITEEGLIEFKVISRMDSLNINLSNDVDATMLLMHREFYCPPSDIGYSTEESCLRHSACSECTERPIPPANE